MGTTGYTPDHWTELLINEMVLPRESDWDIVETWSPRTFGGLEPNLNGVMRFMYGTDPTSSQKYDISWSCSEGRRAPTFSGRWRGTQITVVPITPLFDEIPAGQTTVTLARTPYGNTLVLFDDLLGETPLVLGTDYTVAGNVVTLTAARNGRAIVGYRTQLTMLIDDWKFTYNERTCLMSWDLSAKEV